MTGGRGWQQEEEGGHSHRQDLRPKCSGVFAHISHTNMALPAPLDPPAIALSAYFACLTDAAASSASMFPRLLASHALTHDSSDVVAAAAKAEAPGAVWALRASVRDTRKALDGEAFSASTRGEQLALYADLIDLCLCEGAEPSAASLSLAAHACDTLCSPASVWLHAVECAAPPLALRVSHGTCASACALTGPGASGFALRVPNTLTVCVRDDEGEPLSSLSPSDVAVTMFGACVDDVTPAGAGAVAITYTLWREVDALPLAVSVCGVPLLPTPFAIPVCVLVVCVCLS